MIGPPTNSATPNCQPNSTIKSTPSSNTKLVAANWKAIAAVKSAPLRTMERAMATAAYEHEDEAAPRLPAIRMLRGPASGSRRDISSFETISSMTAEKRNPRLSPQKMSQNITNAIHSAWPNKSRTGKDVSGAALRCVIKPPPGRLRCQT